MNEKTPDPAAPRAGPGVFKVAEDKSEPVLSAPLLRPPAASLVPVNLDVVRRASDGDQVDPAVAVQVGAGEVLDRDAAHVQVVLLPRRGFAGLHRAGLIDADRGVRPGTPA